MQFSKQGNRSTYRLISYFEPIQDGISLAVFVLEAVDNRTVWLEHIPIAAYLLKGVKNVLNHFSHDYQKHLGIRSRPFF